MIYLQKHTDKFSKKSWSKYLVFFVFLVLLFFIFNRSATSSTLASKFFSPFFKVGNFMYTNVLHVPRFFSDKELLLDRNLELETEVDKLRAGLIEYEILKSENEELKKVIGIRPAPDSIVSFIVAKSPQIPFDTLLLDRGSQDGVKVGDRVFTSEKVEVGKIVKVSSTRSTVALNSYAEAVSYGSIERTQEPIELRGMGGAGLRARVAIDFDIVLQDKIMTLGLPRSILAVASSIEEDRADGFKEIYFSLPAPISRIDVVFIESTLDE